MEKENKIVNWNGDLADLPFNDLTADEMGMFLAVCYECQRQENNLVKIELSEIERFGGFYVYGKQRLDACQSGLQNILYSHRIRPVST